MTTNHQDENGQSRPVSLWQLQNQSAPHPMRKRKQSRFAAFPWLALATVIYPAIVVGALWLAASA